MITSQTSGLPVKALDTFGTDRLDAKAVDVPQESPRAAAPEAAERPRIQIPTGNPSGITTYNDDDSGTLVVQLFDKKTGRVIAQFPPDQQLRSYPESAVPAKPSEVEVDV